MADSTAKPTATTSSVNDDDFFGWAKKNWMFILSSLIGVGLYIGSFVQSVNYVGGKDDWNTIRTKIWTVVGLAIGGALALGLAAILYFLANRENAVFFQIIVTTISLGISYSALAVAAMTRV